MIEPLKEDSLALNNRLSFVENAIKLYSPKKVLDIGCGTAEHLTAHLAYFFPDIEFVGFDESHETIEYAGKKFKDIKNLTFCETMPTEKFDMVIASEVIEHVEDPYLFLNMVRDLLIDKGHFVITLPNGYGCHEMMSTLENILNILYIIPLIKGIRNLILMYRNFNVVSSFKKTLKQVQGDAVECHAELVSASILKKNIVNNPSNDTLAICPHVNFFSFSGIENIFKKLGLKKISYKGRMFLHNFIASKLIDKSTSFINWNIKMAERLPPIFVADWMFLLERVEPLEDISSLGNYKRNLYEKFKISLNSYRLKKK